jgi:hypothetical protein
LFSGIEGAITARGLLAGGAACVWNGVAVERAPVALLAKVGDAVAAMGFLAGGAAKVLI